MLPRPRGMRRSCRTIARAFGVRRSSDRRSPARRRADQERGLACAACRASRAAAGRCAGACCACALRDCLCGADTRAARWLPAGLDRARARGWPLRGRFAVAREQAMQVTARLVQSHSAWTPAGKAVAQTTAARRIAKFQHAGGHEPWVVKTGPRLERSGASNPTSGPERDDRASARSARRRPRRAARRSAGAPGGRRGC